MSIRSFTNIANQYPIVPENEVIEPLVQCGVLYLGTVPISSGLRALESIQEPFSHRYPVDGTNTVRGIDSIISIYENGVQLAFTRQPHTAVFFPIASLLYCSSVRFSEVINDQTSSIDWKFLPLNPTELNTDSKHPPIFSLVTHRTKTAPIDECHCFITKNVEASLALVQNVTEIYSGIRSINEMVRCPIFYQLDRYSRRLSESNGVVFVEALSNVETEEKFLFDSSLGGFFYRTEGSLVEVWQLWENENENRPNRPRPPASPFGLHSGLYHDDTTEEVERYLRRMEAENNENDEDCSCSETSSCSSRSASKIEPSRTNEETKDEFNLNLVDFQGSSFEPEEKFEKNSTEKEDYQIDYVRSKEQDPFNYSINERGEKITKDGNRLIFMDVVRPSRRPREGKKPNRTDFEPIPMIDLRSLERLFDKNKVRRERIRSSSIDPISSVYSNSRKSNKEICFLPPANGTKQNDEKKLLSQFVKNIYGASNSIRSTSLSANGSISSKTKRTSTGNNTVDSNFIRNFQQLY